MSLIEEQPQTSQQHHDDVFDTNKTMVYVKPMDVVETNELMRTIQFNTPDTAYNYDAYHQTNSIRQFFKHAKNWSFFKRQFKQTHFSWIGNLIAILLLLIMPLAVHILVPFMKVPEKNNELSPVQQLSMFVSLTFSVAAAIWTVANPLGVLFNVAWNYVTRNQKIKEQMEHFQQEHELQQRRQRDFQKQMLEMEGRLNELEDMLERDVPLFEREIIIVAYDYIIATLQPVIPVKYLPSIILYLVCVGWLTLITVIQWVVTIDISASQQAQIAQGDWKTTMIVMTLCKAIIQAIGFVVFIFLNFIYMLFIYRDIMTYQDHYVYFNEAIPKPSGAPDMEDPSNSNENRQEEARVERSSLTKHVVISSGFFEKEESQRGSILVFCGGYIQHQNKQSVWMDDHIVVKCDHVEDICYGEAVLTSQFFTQVSHVESFLVFKYSNGVHYGIPFALLQKPKYYDTVITSLKQYCTFLNTRVAEFEKKYHALVGGLQLPQQEKELRPVAMSQKEEAPQLIDMKEEEATGSKYYNSAAKKDDSNLLDFSLE